MLLSTNAGSVRSLEFESALNPSPIILLRLEFYTILEITGRKKNRGGGEAKVNLGRREGSVVPATPFVC